MEEKKSGVAGIKKVEMKPIQIAFMLFCLVAAGAFGIEDMLPLCGPGLTIVMLIVFAIIWAHPISKVVSELSALMPGEGGIYVWGKETLGEFWGFSLSWWGTVSIYLASAGYIVLIVNYASHFVPALTDPVIAFIAKLIIIGFFLAINLKGLKEVSWVNTALSIAILVAFTLVTIVGFANWNYSPVEPFIPEDTDLISAVGSGVCFVIWMYCGYECVSNTAGEIKNPEAIPKGFRIVMPLIALSYILPTIAGLVSVGHWSEWGTEGIGYGDVLKECLGYGWGIGFLAIAIIGQAAIFNAYMIEGSRGFFVMADDYLCPGFLAKTNKRGIPVLSLLLLCAITVVMCQLEFATLLTCLMPLALIVYVVLGFCLIKARKEFPVEKRDCWYIKSPVMATIYAILPAVIAIVGMLVNGTEYFLLGFLSLGSAVVAYVVFKWIYKGLYKVDPERYPLNSKTKLAQGDLQQIGLFILLCGIFAFVGSLFLTWYEGSWGAEYYLDVYGTGLMSNFWLMIRIAKIGGAIATVIGLVMLVIGKKTDPITWRGTGEWGEWSSKKSSDIS